jgi:hypothetical protein
MTEPGASSADSGCSARSAGSSRDLSIGTLGVEAPASPMRLAAAGSSRARGVLLGLPHTPPQATGLRRLADVLGLDARCSC